MITIVQGLLITAFEAICCSIIFDSFLKRKEYKEYYEVLLNIVMVAIFFGIALMGIKIFIIKVILVICSITIIMYIYYRKKIIQIFFLSVLYLGILTSIDYCTIIVLNFMFEDRFNDIWADKIKSTMIALISKTILLIVSICINKKWKKNNSFRMINDYEWVRFLYFPMMTIISIVVMIADKNYQSNSILAVCFMLVIMNILIFYLIRDIIVREKHIQDLCILEERNKNQIHMYDEMKASYEEQRKKIHDFKNQITCILGLLESGENQDAIAYARKLNSSEWNDTSLVNTNHPIVNAIINQKYRLAKNKNIDIIMQINNLSRLLLKDEDIVIILANLLDNAIEACEKLSDNRIIKLKFIDDEQETILSIKNPYIGRINFINDVITTSKQSKKEHGIGMLNIKNALKKYNAEENISCKDGYFIYTIIIQKG